MSWRERFGAAAGRGRDTARHGAAFASWERWLGLIQHVPGARRRSAAHLSGRDPTPRLAGLNLGARRRCSSPPEVRRTTAAPRSGPCSGLGGETDRAPQLVRALKGGGEVTSSGRCHATANVILAAGLALGLVGLRQTSATLFSAHAGPWRAGGRPARQLPFRRGPFAADPEPRAARGVKIQPREPPTSSPTCGFDYALLGQAGGPSTSAAGGLGSAVAEGCVAGDLRGSRALTGTNRPDGAARVVGGARARVGQSSYKAPRYPGAASQHPVRRAGPAARTARAQKAAVKKKAEATALAQVRKGPPAFDKLASELSEDPGSKADSGLSAAEPPRGRFVPAFDKRRVGASPPGQVSGLGGGTAVRFPHHQATHPGRGARAPRGLPSRSGAGVHLDSLYMDSLATANKIEGAGPGPRPAGDAGGGRVAGPEAGESGKAVVKFTGGGAHRGKTTSAGSAPLCRRSIPSQLREANDTMLTKFARILTQNVLLLREGRRRNKDCDHFRSSGRRSSAATRASSTRSGPRWGCQDRGRDRTRRFALGRAEERWRGSRSRGNFDQLIAGKTRPPPAAVSPRDASPRADAVRPSTMPA